MSDNKASKWQQYRERLKNTYRLVVMNNETFEEVSSHKLSLLNIYLLISSVLVVVTVLVVMAIAFTPLRKYIPGYSNSIEEALMIEAAQDKLTAMEDELKAQMAYTENLRKVINGEVITEEDVKSDVAQAVVDSIRAVDQSDRQVQLHEELTLEDVGEKAKTSKKVNFVTKDIPLEQLFFSPPVNGQISADFKPEEKHFGIDILSPKNTPVKAAADGYVFISDWTLETGNTIGIQHSNNTLTFYKHNSELLKKVGDFVKAGEAIAIIGNTGKLTSGPHLHFELWHNGRPIDPKEFIMF